MRRIKTILMQRDGMSEVEAESIIESALDNFVDRLEGNGDDPEAICEDWFGLEPDYIEELAGML